MGNICYGIKIKKLVNFFGLEDISSSNNPWDIDENDWEATIVARDYYQDGEDWIPEELHKGDANFIIQQLEQDLIKKI